MNANASIGGNMFRFFKRPKESKNNEAAAYAILSEMLRTGQKAGFTYFTTQFWKWAENELGKDVKEIGFEMMELMRERILFLEPSEMKTMSLQEIDKLATDLLKDAMKK